MNAKLKAYLISGLTVVSSWLGAKAQDNRPDATGDSVKVENVTKIQADARDSVPMATKSAPSDTLNRAKMMRADIEQGTMPQDSLCGPINGMDQLHFDAFCLIAHFESFEVYPYHCGKEKFLTYGVGNTINESGQKVQSSDSIRSVEHMIEVFNHHVDEYIIPVMEQKLPMDQMKPAEIVAIISLAYNCGAGVISELVTPIKNYCATRDNPTAHLRAAYVIKNVFMKHVHAGGCKLAALEKRRNAEFGIFATEDGLSKALLVPEIVMRNNLPCIEPCHKDFYNSPVGACYSFPISAFKNGADLNLEKVVGDSIPQKVDKKLSAGRPVPKITQKTTTKRTGGTKKTKSGNSKSGQRKHTSKAYSYNSGRGGR